jgi:hypothetical protein
VRIRVLDDRIQVAQAVAHFARDFGLGDDVDQQTLAEAPRPA